jgi:hypothetical protein
MQLHCLEPSAVFQTDPIAERLAVINNIRIDDWAVDKKGTRLFITEWIAAHMQDSVLLNKPLLMQEVRGI